MSYPSLHPSVCFTSKTKSFNTTGGFGLNLIWMFCPLRCIGNEVQAETQGSVRWIKINPRWTRRVQSIDHSASITVAAFVAMIVRLFNGLLLGDSYL
jgi:hypothetical protein